MALPPLSFVQAKELASGPYGATLLRTAGSYVVPMCWPKTSIDHEEVELTNGTAFFLKTPQAVFAVTAAHVIRGFLEAKELDPRLACGLLDSDTLIDLDRDLIAIGSNVDIATFRVSESVIAKLNKQPLTAWPPQTPQVGKGVFYAGFPGQVRQRLAVREFSFGLCSGAGVADHVDSQNIVTSINHDDLVDPLGHGFPPEDFDFGGMSGGPLLAVIETGIVSWGLAGVIFKGSNLGGGLLYGARATSIREDETIAE